MISCSCFPVCSYRCLNYRRTNAVSWCIKKKKKSRGECRCFGTTPSFWYPVRAQRRAGCANLALATLPCVSSTAYMSLHSAVANKRSRDKYKDEPDIIYVPDCANMPFTLTELKEDAEFEDLVKVEWASYETPLCRLIRLFFPLHGQGPEARAVALKESTERQIGWHRGDASSRWIKVIDTDTGRLAGAACWHIFESDPYAEPSEEECTWYPAGADREMANDLMEQFMTPRMTYMGKPHMCMCCQLDGFTETRLTGSVLEICFVHPDFRRRGAGRLLMEWGIAKADRMGMESYIDATAEGKPLYEAYGFVAANRLDFNLDKHDASPNRKELEQQLLPFSFWPMWRPAGGKPKIADIKKPWE